MYTPYFPKTKQLLWMVIVAMICIILMGAAPGVASADSPQPSVSNNICVIASRGLNLRTGPSTYYWSKATLPFGTKVSIISKSGSWSSVRYGRHTGWMYSSYLGTCRSTPRCDSNYSGYCVPIVSYDLDCKDVGSNFRVVGYDKHRFDGDGDGLACESRY